MEAPFVALTSASLRKRVPSSKTHTPVRPRVTVLPVAHSSCDVNNHPCRCAGVASLVLIKYFLCLVLCFVDSNNSLIDVLKEFNEGGTLSQYNADGVRLHLILKFCSTYYYFRSCTVIILVVNETGCVYTRKTNDAKRYGCGACFSGDGQSLRPK